ncbi:hypothetical protein [Halorussus amylolyticus]|uniref:hypothetical protein n=1 Tax=Halorussus amylolyticus TaxID=1126242 RepID=UPI0010491152|nr:hypothetical protein [Halorussus amylolyticus]
MSEPSVLESLPDRAMAESEVERLGASESVAWTDSLALGSNAKAGTVGSWILEADGTAHVLFYGMDGWVSKGSFDTDGLDADEKRERAEELLGM